MTTDNDTQEAPRAACGRAVSANPGAAGGCNRASCTRCYPKGWSKELWAGQDPGRLAVIAEIAAIEANPLPCLPDPHCFCPTCYRYEQLYCIVAD